MLFASLRCEDALWHCGSAGICHFQVSSSSPWCVRPDSAAAGRIALRCVGGPFEDCRSRPG
jgi:hypothetical protein